MVAWGFGFWMWRQILARVVLFLMSAEYSLVMWGAWPGTLVSWPWLRLSMIYCCALRLWSQICVTCRRCWFPVSVALSCCVGARCLRPVGWLHNFEMVTEHFVVEGMTFSLPHIFPNPCFLFGSGLNCMSLDYRFHLISNLSYILFRIFISHML